MPRAAHQPTPNKAHANDNDVFTNPDDDNETNADSTTGHHSNNNKTNEEISTPTNTPSSGGTTTTGAKIPLFKGLREQQQHKTDRSTSGDAHGELPNQETTSSTPSSLAEPGTQTCLKEGADTKEEQGVAEGQHQAKEETDDGFGSLE